jgi:hypothetical protein
MDRNQPTSDIRVSGALRQIIRVAFESHALRATAATNAFDSVQELQNLIASLSTKDRSGESIDPVDPWPRRLMAAFSLI